MKGLVSFNMQRMSSSIVDVNHQKLHKWNIQEECNALPESIFYIFILTCLTGHKLMLMTLLSLSTPSSTKGVLKYMSEAVISRRGGSGSGGGKINGIESVTEVIVQNTSYTIPNHIGNISVRIFGGGGGGGPWGGGGGGWMNNGEFNINNGSTVSITIGTGGGWKYTGSATSFGTYLSANGGRGGDGGGGDGGSGGGGGSQGTKGGNGYQFGGGGGGTHGGTTSSSSGGDGGIWGGGGGHTVNGYGDGYHGGNGGYYGGGGGGVSSYLNSAGIGGWYNDNGTWKQSGLGGNGGYPGGSSWSGVTGNAEDGTNTIGWINIEGFLQGDGKAPTYYNTFNTSNSQFYNENYGWYGGGGGFGGRGGIEKGSWQWSPAQTGGGGGYGGNGGNYGGGGGGYGKGADGGDYCGGGGGGYFSKGGTGWTDHYGICGGGGGYGRGGTWSSNSLYVEEPGFGGGGGQNQAGGSGICIIQYYKPI